MRVTNNPCRAAVRTKMSKTILTNCQLWFKHHHREFCQPTCILLHSSLFWLFLALTVFTTNNGRKKTDPNLSNNKCTFKILGSTKSNTQSNSRGKTRQVAAIWSQFHHRAHFTSHMAKVSPVAGWTRVRLWRWGTSHFFAQFGVVLQTHPWANVMGMADRHLVHLRDVSFRMLI